MRRAFKIWALLLGGALFQSPPSPTPVFVTYTSQTLGAGVGSISCNFYSQSPSPQQVHIACYSGTTLKRNEISTVSAVSSVGLFEVSGVGAVVWIFTPGTSPLIQYQISAISPDPLQTPAIGNGTF